MEHDWVTVEVKAHGGTVLPMTYCSHCGYAVLGDTPPAVLGSVVDYHVVLHGPPYCNGEWTGFHICEVGRRDSAKKEIGSPEYLEKMRRDLARINEQQEALLQIFRQLDLGDDWQGFELVNGNLMHRHFGSDAVAVGSDYQRVRFTIGGDDINWASVFTVSQFLEMVDCLNVCADKLRSHLKPGQTYGNPSSRLWDQP